jgi:hypothetical protein
MRTTVIIPALSLLLLAGCNSLVAQTTDTAEFEQLKSQVAAQQKTLEHQQAQIELLLQALAEQKEMLARLVPQEDRTKAALVAAVYSPVTPRAEASARPAEPQPSAKPAEPQVTVQPFDQPQTPEQQKVEQELQRGPEIADVTPNTPAVQLGPAKVRLIGYPALTQIWRSTNAGGGTGTSFAGIPFDNKVEGNTSEFRLSSQSTRLAIRVDAELGKGKESGYFEMDFGGTNPGNVAVTSSSYGFRVRQAWADYKQGKWELTGGQLFSLMTPIKKLILPWPGDVATTQVLDTNYVAGLVFGRFPQLRVDYEASKNVAFAVSFENPEQQVGSGSLGVVFPSGIASILNNQYNTGSNDLKVPNMTPDLVLKAAFDGPVGGRATHFDAGTVLRVFRNYNPTQSGMSGKDYAPGVGVNGDFSYEFVKGVRFMFNGFYGYGAGRYVGGLVPDVIVQADGKILPITSYSWVSGFEIAPNKATGMYAYYSGVYGERKTAIDTDGSFIGWGFPGSSNAADRIISEATAGYSKVLWKAENLGSVQWGVQYGYVWLHPWSAGSGPSEASTNMVFSQLRYNLP